ncbi:MAG TPA: alpha-L-fucosidase, partial [Gemmatimonadaceae bacterium]
MLQTLATPGDASWFVHDRFGLFIHWGLYSLAARHEWVMSRECITAAEYQRRYFQHFDPDLYDPNQWADAAADAGMKYFVVTTKHHEGFCLWDSDLTDYKSTKTPYGKDLIRPMIEAFRSRGLRTGFYYSLLDWHHPDYVVDVDNHPLRNQLDKSSGLPIGDDDPNRGRDQARYAQYLHGQVRELLTRYGPVDVLWFDFSFISDKGRPHDDFCFNKGRDAWQSEKLIAMIRELAPHVLLTDRLDLNLPLSGGDFKTPEQTQPRYWVHIEHEGKKVPVVWE